MAEANTGTSELTELVNAEFIRTVILDYAVDYTVAAPFCLWQDLRGRATKVGSFPRLVLDTSTDTGETTELSTTSLETTDVQITAAEIGLRRRVFDPSVEETVIGRALFDLIARDAGVLAAVSLDDDIVALYPSLANSVGTSGSDLTLANCVEAQASIRKQKMRGSLVYVFDDQQAQDFQAACAASTSTTINGFLNLAITGSTDSAYLGTFMGAPVWQTGLCDTANTGTNVVGACYIRGDTNPTSACFGAVITRDVRLESIRVPKKRATEVVMSAKWAPGEIADESGVKIVTDA